MINLDKFKAFDRMGNRFLEVLLSTVCFGPYFATWMLLRNASALVEAKGVRSEPCAMSRSIREDCPLSALLYILALEPFPRKLKMIGFYK